MTTIQLSCATPWAVAVGVTVMCLFMGGVVWYRLLYSGDPSPGRPGTRGRPRHGKHNKQQQQHTDGQRDTEALKNGCLGIGVTLEELQDVDSTCKERTKQTQGIVAQPQADDKKVFRERREDICLAVAKAAPSVDSDSIGFQADNTCDIYYSGDGIAGHKMATLDCPFMDKNKLHLDIPPLSDESSHYDNSHCTIDQQVQGLPCQHENGSVDKDSVDLLNKCQNADKLESSDFEEVPTQEPCTEKSVNPVLRRTNQSRRQTGEVNRKALCCTGDDDILIDEAFEEFEAEKKRSPLPRFSELEVLDLADMDPNEDKYVARASISLSRSNSNASNPPSELKRVSLKDVHRKLSQDSVDSQISHDHNRNQVIKQNSEELAEEVLKSEAGVISKNEGAKTEAVFVAQQDMSTANAGNEDISIGFQSENLSEQSSPPTYQVFCAKDQIQDVTALETGAKHTQVQSTESCPTSSSEDFVQATIPDLTCFSEDDLCDKDQGQGTRTESVLVDVPSTKQMMDKDSIGGLSNSVLNDASQDLEIKMREEVKTNCDNLKKENAVERTANAQPLDVPSNINTCTELKVNTDKKSKTMDTSEKCDEKRDLNKSSERVEILDKTIQHTHVERKSSLQSSSPSELKKDSAGRSVLETTAVSPVEDAKDIRSVQTQAQDDTVQGADLKDLQDRLEKETKQRKRADDWSDFMSLELDAHIRARQEAEERFSRLSRAYRTLLGKYQELQAALTSGKAHLMQTQVSVRSDASEYHDTLEELSSPAVTNDKLFHEVKGAREFWEKTRQSGCDDEVCKEQSKALENLTNGKYLDDLLNNNSNHNESTQSSVASSTTSPVSHSTPRQTVKVKIEGDSASPKVSPVMRKHEMTRLSPSNSFRRTGLSPRLAVKAKQPQSTGSASLSSSESDLFYETAEDLNMSDNHSSIYDEEGESNEDSIRNVKRTKMVWEQMMSQSPKVSPKLPRKLPTKVYPISDDSVYESPSLSEKSNGTEGASAILHDLDIQRELEIQHELGEVSNSDSVLSDSISNISETKAMWEQKLTTDENEDQQNFARHDRTRRSTKFLNLRQQWEKATEEENNESHV